LAEQVDKVEGNFELCANQKLVLEDELKDARSNEEACETENIKLRRQVEDGESSSAHSEPEGMPSPLHLHPPPTPS